MESPTRKSSTFMSHIKCEGLVWGQVQSPELRFSKTATVPCAANCSGEAEPPDSWETSFLHVQTGLGRRKDRA